MGRLIGFPTTGDNPAAITQCLDYVDSKLDFYPFRRRTYVHNGVESRVWSVSDGVNSGLILNAHVDVVPGAAEMFTLRRKGDRLLGRGVSDMKFAIPLFIDALKNVYARRRTLPEVCLMLTADEERGGVNGVGHLVNDLGYRSGLAFVPDGGDGNHVVEEAKGVVHLGVTFSGRAAHASRPWEGESAIDKAVSFVNRLRRSFPILKEEGWVDTVNVGKISGGVQTNQVADTAAISLDVRYLPGTDLESMVAKISSFGDARVERLITASSFRVDRNHPLVQRWVRLLGDDTSVFINEHGASDGRFFAAAGIPTVVSKPVGGHIHHPDEWLSLSSMISFGQKIEEFVESMI